MLALYLTLALLPAQAQNPRLTQYLDLAQATLREPVTAGELRRAVLSGSGIKAMRTLFDSTLTEAVRLDGALITPERGGEAMLTEGELVLVDYPDPVHPVVRDMAAMQGRPAELLTMLESSEHGRFLLDSTGGLHALLFQLREAPPTPAQASVLRDVIRRTVQTHYKTWTTDPVIQAEQIERTDWRGRYVGFWHLHPPRVSSDGFAVGLEPSVPDMHNALELGQFLTIVFQPQGFDLYDLSPLARSGTIDLSLAERIEYRDASWQVYFEERLRLAQGASTP